jgi:hypothetical protein
MMKNSLCFEWSTQYIHVGSFEESVKRLSGSEKCRCHMDVLYRMNSQRKCWFQSFRSTYVLRDGMDGIGILLRACCGVMNGAMFVLYLHLHPS